MSLLRRIGAVLSASERVEVANPVPDGKTPYVDDLRIDPDEDGWHLTLWTDDGKRHDYRLGVPEQLEDEVARTISRWLDEGGRK